MVDFEPKYSTFDRYGTLTTFGRSALTRELPGLNRSTACLDSSGENR